VTYQDGETRVPEAIGKPCPNFVFPNQKDLDYVKVELDPVSLKTVSENLSQIVDPLTRQLLWHTLWEMVVDGKLKPADYAEVVLKHGANERNSQILSKILRKISDLDGNHPTALKYMKEDERKEYQKRIESFLKKKWFTSPSGSDLQLIWYHAFMDVASSPQAVEMLTRVLTQKGRTWIVKGMRLDQERRWEFLQALARNSPQPEKVKSLIQEALKQDPTDMGEKSAITALAMIPNPSEKRNWLDNMLANPRPLPLAKLRQAMGAYHILGQEEFTRDSVDSYFEKLPQLALSPSHEDDEFSDWFAETMYPSLCDPMIVEKTESMLMKYPQLPAKIEKILRVGKQEEERCIRARRS
jgi:aminopeptidase N